MTWTPVRIVLDRTDGGRPAGHIECGDRTVDLRGWTRAGEGVVDLEVDTSWEDFVEMLAARVRA